MPTNVIRRIAARLASLAALVIVATPLLAQPPKLGPSLADRATTALQKGDRAAARALYERWLEADPQDESAWYNLACLYALGGEKTLALDAFEKSVEAGWKDAVHPTKDTDLDAVRADARFAAALDRIRARAAAEGPRGAVRHWATMESRGSYLVMLPPDYESSSKHYPVCVILHGSGSSDARHGRLADTMGREGVIYIAPRAPYPHAGVVATGNMGWTAWPPDNMAETEAAYAHVPTDYVDWIFTCVDEVQSRYRARKGKVYIYGHSQGGNFANVAALTHPERVAAYYSQAASLPAERFLGAMQARRMKENGVRATLIHGADDSVVPTSTSTKIDAVLTEAGVEHSFRIVPGDHGFSAEMLAEVRAWVDREMR